MERRHGRDFSSWLCESVVLYKGEARRRKEFGGGYQVDKPKGALRVLVSQLLEIEGKPNQKRRGEDHGVSLRERETIYSTSLAGRGNRR